MLDMDPGVCEHPKIGLFLKSIAINRPLVCKVQHIIDIQMLHKISNACDALGSPITFWAIFLVAYFGFLRISNLVPSRSKHFDNTRNIMPGDIVIGTPGALVIVKWSKTMQHRDTVQIVQIPLLGSSGICPVKAVVALSNQHKLLTQDPLFLTSKGYIVNQSQVRKALSVIIELLGLPRGSLTFRVLDGRAPRGR